MRSLLNLKAVKTSAEITVLPIRVRKASLFVASVISIALSAVGGTTYEVGEGKPYANINDVPLEKIAAGDTVLIHHRATPYREKWVIAARGTADQPITFRGVPDRDGALPVIDGESATTRRELSYWNEERSIIKIGGSSIPESDGPPSYIVIENLELRGARPPRTFLDDGGGSGDPVKRSYIANAAGVYIEYGEHIVIRGCMFTDCGNGLFIASGDEFQSRNILIDANHIVGNGNADSLYEHNTYTAAIGIIYQFNRFGPLANGAKGNNLKDRSAGLVVRYNWIEGGNRQLDLVDAEDSSVIEDDPAYRTTFVYGNVLIEPAGAGNRQIVHYGGDSGNEAGYRKGLLYFYHNTLVSTRTDRTTLLRLSTMDESCDARNNILYVQHAGNGFSMLDNSGRLTLRTNWLKPGWVKSFDGGAEGEIDDDGSSIVGIAPGFVDEGGQDFGLSAESDCVDGAGALRDDLPDEQQLKQQYVPHQQHIARSVRGAAVDVGAFERDSGDPRGDLNCDGALDFDDIDPFVLALIDRSSYEQSYPDCDFARADINQDGTVDFDDIDGFVECLVNDGCG